MVRVLLLFVAACLAGPVMASDAQALIEEFHVALTGLSTTQNADFESRYEAIAPVVDATHDLAFIARLTLGYHWSALGDAQQQQFLDRFRELSVATYASRFQDLSGKRFEIVAVESQPRGRELVRARLVLPEREPIEFDYLLHETDAGWRIVNILVDGVSDLALKRAEYTRRMSDGNFDSLLALLDEQSERHKQGE